jgi:hypothetical protein
MRLTRRRSRLRRGRRVQPLLDGSPLRFEAHYGRGRRVALSPDAPLPLTTESAIQITVWRHVKEDGGGNPHSVARGHATKPITIEIPEIREPKRHTNQSTAQDKREEVFAEEHGNGSDHRKRAQANEC